MGRINTGGAKKRTGDNIALASSVSGTTLKLNPPKGYYDGVTGTVNITDADFVASKILTGTNLFGVNGSLTPLNYATGSIGIARNNTETLLFHTYAGLTFRPKFVEISMNDSTDNMNHVILFDSNLIVANTGQEIDCGYHTRIQYKLDGSSTPRDLQGVLLKGDTASISDTGFTFPYVTKSLSAFGAGNDAYTFKAWG